MSICFLLSFQVSKNCDWTQQPVDIRQRAPAVSVNININSVFICFLYKFYAMDKNCVYKLELHHFNNYW
jgi:hypothetical protein